MRVTLAGAARWFARAKVHLKNNIEKAETVSLEEARQEAMFQSTGIYSTRQLRKMGHPYARRRPKPPADPRIINIQTGLFHASWVPSLPFYVNGGFRMSLFNLAPYSGYMRGTRLMITRDIGSIVAEQTYSSRFRRLERAVESTWPK